MEYHELLQALAERIGGGAELTPDASGAVMLNIDDMEVTILGLDEVRAVAFAAPIAEPPPEDRLERLYQAALQANYNFQGTSGATLSINPETNELSLCRLMPVAVLDGDSFVQELERFVNTLETWRKLISDYRASTDDGKPDGADQEVVAGFGATGFMQV